MDTDAQLSERDRSSDPDEGQEERSRSARFPTRSLRRRLLLLVAACLAFVGLLSAFVLQPFQVPSASMENTLRVGDRLLVNKLAYDFGDGPRRGDVIVFDGIGTFRQDAPEENPVRGALRAVGAALGLARPADNYYVKRVIGVGGDRVTCCDKRGRIMVNGKPVDEAYLHPGDAPSSDPFDVVVPDGKLWVMGDHRDKSRDSRALLGQPGGGMVPVDKVIGRADWIGWPVRRWTTLDRPSSFEGIPAPAGAHG
ncbi:signal peptidase I [Streptomyces sp. NPDC003077]|uniref:signal peptidase I n=1 Tax=Streptomyces sp. NPDC003077 TaxID=3154443 RepID=UPI0033AAE525